MPKWTEKDSLTFIDYGKAFTPMGNAQYKIIGELISSDRLSGAVHELCCDAGDLARLILEQNTEITLTAWDGSPTMLAHTAKKCAPYRNRLRTELFNIADAEWRERLQGASAVYSSLAVHHLNAKEKQKLFKDIYATLKEGGCFVLADLMMPVNKIGLSICAWQWEQEVARNSNQLYQDSRAQEAFQDLKWNFYRHPYDDPIDKPSSVQEHLYWLSEAGFADVDLHMMIGGHAIMSARKP